VRGARQRGMVVGDRGLEPQDDHDVTALLGSVQGGSYGVQDGVRRHAHPDALEAKERRQGAVGGEGLAAWRVVRSARGLQTGMHAH
jgi:hypothetical protein